MSDARNGYATFSHFGSNLDRKIPSIHVIQSLHKAAAVANAAKDLTVADHDCIPNGSVVIKAVAVWPHLLLFATAGDSGDHPSEM